MKTFISQQPNVIANGGGIPTETFLFQQQKADIGVK